MLLILALAAVLPRFLHLTPALALPILVIGPIAASRVDTHGLGRNVVAALLESALPRVQARPAVADWRRSRDPRPVEDLSRFSGAARGRNIVMVALESTAAQYLRLYGSRYDTMPRLDVLARHALIFDNAYAVYPESIKGLFSALCSTYPAFDSRAEDYEHITRPAVPEVLAAAGYRTALFHSGRFAYLGMESVVRNRGFQTLEDAGDIGGNHESSFGVDEPATVARILAWLDSLPRGRPFFLAYLPIAGHHPYATPGRGPFTGTADINQYRNALRYGDESLGALAAGLRARGLENDTVWVIYGDHGEAFGQHPGNYGHTFFVYEENVHVPLVIAAPGLLRDLTRVHKPVSLVDIAPTILDLAGIAPPPAYQGRTMLDSSFRMSLFFADYSMGILGLRDGPWKFIYEIEPGRAKLFNLDHDPTESANLAARDPARASWYRQVVRGWSGAQKTLLASRGAH